MPTFRVQSVMYPTTNLLRDATVNTFHVDTVSGPPDFAALSLAWETFMSGQRALFADSVRQFDHVLKVYNLADPEPRAPVYEDTWSFSEALVGEMLPPEVALCISFEGGRVSGEDQARKRGRIYLGPFDIQYTVDGRPNPDVCSDLVAAFSTFIESLNAAGFYFVVYSRANAATVAVERVWVDEEWDTQRRRGRESTGSATTAWFAQVLS